MALPIEFINRTQALLGSQYAMLEQALLEDVPVSIRMNHRKLDFVPGAEPVKWSDSGYYLPERLSFTFDPLFHAGAYYVQEASSMFLEQVVCTYLQNPVKCLDLCAAPGGKSTHLLSTLPEGSLLVSNEVIRTRSNILAENITKWGYANSVVTNSDPEDIGKLTHFFDVVVADVPCSGEGMFRKDTDSTDEWSVANVELCASRQRRIIHDVWNALAPGGLLIYSTCTYNTEEDEENIHYFTRELGAEALPVPLKDEWMVTGALRYTHPVYRFFPHKTKGEGFFLAVLRKPEGDLGGISPKSKSRKEKGKQVPDKFPDEPRHWISSAEAFQFLSRGEYLQAFPLIHAEAYKRITENLRIVSAGILLGQVKGKDIIPAQSLANSLYLNKAAFVSFDVTWEQAICFLRREPITLPDEMKKGYVLITYNSIPLGFVKHLGNRTNNLYPQEWRIRTGYIPEKVRLLK